MPTTLRQFIKIRAYPGGEIWFLTFAAISPYAPEVYFAAPSDGELLPTSAIADYITVGDWQVRVLSAGAFEAVDAGVVNVGGYGLSGLTLRGTSDNRITLAVSAAGGISGSNTAGQTVYVDGSSKVNLCPEHNLTYRPDTRIYKRSRTHCPVDGAPLRSLLAEFRQDRDPEGLTFEEEWW